MNIKLLLTVASGVLLSACQHYVVPPAFPEKAPILTEKCQELKMVPTGTESLSGVLLVVTDNYAEYHKCSIRVDAWQEWYDAQRKIYEDLTKPKSYFWRK